MYVWMLAAILVISGASVFTSCESNGDNPVQEPEKSVAEKNRDAFIEHTRSTVKTLAENLNFESWEAANTYNMYFNQYVLLNKDLVGTFGLTVLALAAQNVFDVEEGSELAAMGIKRYIDVDLSNFKYRFTMKDDNTTFDFEQADAFEFIMNGFNPATQQVEKGLYKIALKSGGTGRKIVIPMKNTDAGAIVLTIPYDLEFAMSSKFTGAWHDDFSGVVSFQLPEGATDTSKGYTAKATINSDILPSEGKKGDKTQLDLTISSDRVNGIANVLASWTQNGRKMIEMSLKESGTNMGGISNLDMSQFTTSSSIFEVIGAILGTRSIDEAKVTLLDDLTTTMSVSNLLKLLQIDSEYRTVGRNYADKATIDEYCKKLNEVVKAEIYCKHTNQTLPMRLATIPVGIDYWAVYEFEFDKGDYVSLLSMLDRKTFAYVLNIMDHSADHMQNSVITVRQLVEFVILLNKTFGDVEIPLN
jgi:hypothetical protein